MFVAFIRWWYGPGWSRALRAVVTWTASVERSFSIGILFTTLFSPWKQIISLPGKSLDAKFRALVDNFVSRVIGFFVRFIVLLTALFLTAVAGVFGLISAIIWPLLPVGVIYFLIRGIIG